jgi:hypothetical protein
MKWNVFRNCFSKIPGEQQTNFRATMQNMFMLNWALLMFHLVATRNVTGTVEILLPITTEHLIIQNVVPLVQCHILYVILHQTGILHMVVPWHSWLVAGL